MIIPVVIEARHVRLTAAHVELLFGAGHALTSLVPLDFTARFAATDVVDVRGPAGTLKNVRVLGPTVDATHVLLSRDDMGILCRNLSSVPAAGAVDATCSVDGPRGTVMLDLDAVLLLRRLVVTTDHARAHGLAAVSGADVVVHGERAREVRGVRVEIGAGLYLAIDITDANAFDVGPTTRARLSPATERSAEGRTADPSTRASPA